MKTLTLLLLALILSVGTIFVGGCAQINEAPAESAPVAPEETEKPVVTDTGAGETEKPTPTDTAAEETEQPIKPLNTVAIDKYKGLWMPFLRETQIAVDDIDNLQSDGVNIVSIGIRICVDENRNITECESEAEIKQAINEFHKSGIRTFLVLNPGHPDFGINPFSSDASGKPLLDELTPLALKWAGIAEDYGAEIFCPVNEPQLLSYQNEQDVSDWAQELLPELREVYHGKIAFVVQTHAEGLYTYNLDGYDYIANGGLTCTQDIVEHPDWTERTINENLDNLKTCYPDNKYFFFGAGAFTGHDYYWWEPIAPENMSEHMPDLPADFFTVSDESQAEFYELFFNTTWEEVEGYFIPVYKGWEYRDKPAEQTIRDWFASPA